jgi:type IV fimbrial biogenesis protein FimT
MRPRRSNGFSLLELLVVLAIAAVLISVAVPGFTETRRAAALTVAVNQLIGAIHFARSASILNNVPTVICLSADGVQCTSSGREPIRGWLVFRDHDRTSPAALDAGDSLLRKADLPNDLSIQATRAALTFWPTTRSGTPGTFIFCSLQVQGAGREVVVSQTGRPRVAETSPAECTP